MVDALARMLRDQAPGQVAGGEDGVIGLARHAVAVEDGLDAGPGAWGIRDEDDAPSATGFGQGAESDQRLARPR